MSLISFIKDAGEKLLGIGDAKAAQDAATAAPTPENVAQLSDVAGKAIAAYIVQMKLDVKDLTVAFDAPSATVTVGGEAADQATKEKVVLCCGNVAHVAAVTDNLTVANAEPESQWHTVVSGDNLSKIAKQYYDNPNKYPVIFEANKPMLSDPDKIYPGQVLRIPPLAA
jgi:nucleoid-associated protein YgaU